MTGTASPPRSPGLQRTGANLLETAVTAQPSNRTVIDAFDHSSWSERAPTIKFGTGTRPPLLNPNGAPGPGSYKIPTTMSKIIESSIASPPQFSLRGRTKFGDPNERSMSKSNASEPGPGQYDLYGKFLNGTNPRKSAFPKSETIRDSSGLGPGPGSYQPLQSMGKQVLSTKQGGNMVVFPKGERPTLIPPGQTDIGPAEYKPAPAACEPQLDSRKRTCATIKFGIGYRSGSLKEKPDFSEPSPGPGAYQLPGGIATKAKGSPYRDSPTAILSGRNKFGSPW